MKFSLLSIFLVLLIANCAYGFFFKNLKKTPECESVIQNSQYECTESLTECRVCCAFDLNRKNDLYSPPFGSDGEDQKKNHISADL